MAFIHAGMLERKADVCAQIHSESRRDGVYSHCLNRVERFADFIKKTVDYGFWTKVKELALLC
jgi:3-dehydro-L-gulonate 2-dehydrogenase